MPGVELDEELQRCLSLTARNEGRSESDVANEAVRLYLAKYDPTMSRYDPALVAEARRQSLRAAARGWTDEDEAWEALAAADDPLDDMTDPATKHAAE